MSLEDVSVSCCSNFRAVIHKHSLYVNKPKNDQCSSYGRYLIMEDFKLYSVCVKSLKFDMAYSTMYVSVNTVVEFYREAGEIQCIFAP